MKILENTNFNFDFLEKEIKSEDELSLVNPTATLPFDQGYWRNFFVENPKENPAYSLYFEINGQLAGHTALKRFKERNNQIFLCLVYLSPAFRGHDYSKKMYELTEKFLVEKLFPDQYFLNVLGRNIRALRSYEKFGFKIASESQERVQMVKNLKNS